MNIEEVAVKFQVHPGTVRGWIKRGLPVVEVGSRGVGYVLDLNEAILWHRRNVLRELNFADFDLTGAIEGLTN